MAMRPTTCGELLTSLLRDFGVELIFGIPGVHTVELYRGLPASGIRHVTPRHEQGAGFMADGYARASGKVGVCFVITAVGNTIIVCAAVGLVAGLVDSEFLWDMVSMGTLTAFAVVSIAVRS
jgi:acetolactate synthase I/II/III large subunit